MSINNGSIRFDGIVVLRPESPERGAAYVVRRLVRSFIERVEEDQPVLDKYIDIKFD